MNYTTARTELPPRFSMQEVSVPSPNNPLGVEHLDMPASPDRVWKAIRTGTA